MNPPKMPIHIGDYMRNTGHLRAAEHGAYLMLLFHYWSTGSLPDDHRQLAAIARMSAAEWRKARPVLERFFDPGWRHGRVEKDLAAARASYEKRAKAGEKGGKAKSESKQSSSNATAMPEQPYTLDQNTNSEEARASSSRVRKRGSRLPDDWQPSSHDFRAASEIGLRLVEIEIEADKFRDYWRARAGPGGVKLDWSATWRNWCRTAKERGNGNGKVHRTSLVERGHQLAEQARELERAAGVGREDDAVGSH